MSSQHDLRTKTLRISRRGYEYRFLSITPTNEQHPTLAFFHGFPSISKEWSRQIQHFTTQGYGVFVPDMLGYGGTSKPDDVSAYDSREMVEDMIEVMDHECIHHIHGIGHDTGSLFLSRLYNYYPHRLHSLTFISVPYSPPGMPFDLDAVNAQMKELIGMEKFGYMRFLASSSGPIVIEAHLQSFHALIYNSDANLMADNFYPPAKLETWLTADCGGNQIIVTEAERDRWLSAFREGGLKGPTNWYRAMLGNINISREREALSVGQISEKVLVPVLSIESQPDKASIPDFMAGSMKTFAARLSVNVVQARGHWPHIVAYEEVNRLIQRHVCSG